MRVVGYCNECRRFKPVRLTPLAAAIQAKGGIAGGTCAQCEDDIERSRLARR